MMPRVNSYRRINKKKKQLDSKYMKKAEEKKKLPNTALGTRQRK